MKLKYEKIHSDARDLERANQEDACFDLYATRNVRINAHTQKAVPTGIKIDIPKGYWGRILERSGVSLRYPCIVKAGVIDSGYTGEIKVIIGNYSYAPIHIAKGMKLAQIAILKLPKFEAELVEKIEKETERGEKGFGSSDEK